MKYLSVVLLMVIGAQSIGAPANAAESDEGILVGRIAHIEGRLLRYVGEEKDWVVTVKDTPFGLEDALYSEDDAKAEFIMPNGTWMRVGGNTQVQLINLDPEATTVDVASGLARLYNKSGDTIIKVTTPFGYVVAPGDTIFDLYVGDESLEVIAVRGNVDFVHDGTGTRYEVKEGSSSLIADTKETALGNGMVDADWDDWNGLRDSVWAQRFASAGNFSDLLPEPIREESYALEENGRWERVFYEGAYRDMWRPTNVDPEWEPFTVGRWSVYYGDNCWIPDEPFGYVTHHYGSWFFVESFQAWYWVPPLIRAGAGVPLFNISFGWYPGRVGWIHSGASVGWVPLHPTEDYYCHSPWGHRTVVVGPPMIAQINISRYRYLDHAVIIPQDHLYKGTRYTPYLERNVNRTTLVNNFRPATVINNTVIDSFNADKGRFAQTDVKVVRKPHPAALDRIDTNQKMIRTVGRDNRQDIKQDLKRMNAVAQPAPKSDVHAPRLTTRLVDVDKVVGPLNEVPVPQKEIKPKNRERRLAPENWPSLDRQYQGTRGQRRIDQGPETTDQDATRGIRLPRDTGGPFVEQANSPHIQDRRRGVAESQVTEQPSSPQGINQDALRQQEMQRRQEEEMQRNRQVELQRQQQQEMMQHRQQEDVERNRQVELQRHQQQEMVQRQQQEMQRRQQEEVGRNRQVELQRHQQQEMVQRQQQEIQRRQEEEIQRNRQIELQRHQQQEEEAQRQQQGQPQQQRGKRPQGQEQERK